METTYGIGSSKIKICCSSSQKNKTLIYLTQKALLLLYYSLIRSNVMYCLTSWCHGNKIFVNRIQRMANKFVRIIFKMQSRQSLKTVMQKFNVLSVNQLLTTQVALFVYKYEKGTLLLAFNDYLKKRLFQELPYLKLFKILPYLLQDCS